MSEGPVRQCPNCGQALRFPSHVGGVLMVCPVCGHRFASPFRLAGDPALATPPRPAPLRPAPVPDPVLQPTALPEPDPATPAPAEAKPIRPNTLAARVAAKYAKKAS